MYEVGARRMRDATALFVGEWLLAACLPAPLSVVGGEARSAFVGLYPPTMVTVLVAGVAGAVFLVWGPVLALDSLPAKWHRRSAAASLCMTFSAAWAGLAAAAKDLGAFRYCMLASTLWVLAIIPVSHCLKRATVTSMPRQAMN